MLIGLAISAAATVLVLARKDSGLGVREAGISLSQVENSSGRSGNSAGPAVTVLQAAAPSEANDRAAHVDQPMALIPLKATRFHIVRPGETLSSIARKYYGTTAATGKILEANKAALDNPNRIRPGTKLTIPD
jgi:nucleoid-associated protein YgaU